MTYYPDFFVFSWGTRAYVPRHIVGLPRHVVANQALPHNLSCGGKASFLKY